MEVRKAFGPRAPGQAGWMGQTDDGMGNGLGPPGAQTPHPLPLLRGGHFGLELSCPWEPS